MGIVFDVLILLVWDLGVILKIEIGLFWKWIEFKFDVGEFDILVGNYWNEVCSWKWFIIVLFVVEEVYVVFFFLFF